jgi:hypothetical protein
VPVRVVDGDCHRSCTIVGSPGVTVTMCACATSPALASNAARMKIVLPRGRQCGPEVRTDHGCSLLDANMTLTYAPKGSGSGRKPGQRRS